MYIDMIIGCSLDKGVAMSVNPLDLQTVFSHINQVGKQHALEKENQMIRQDGLNHSLSEKSKQDAEDIPITKDVSEGAGKIKDKDNINKRKKRGNKKDGDDPDDAEDSDEDGLSDEVVRDPLIGTKIDIIG